MSVNEKSWYKDLLKLNDDFFKIAIVNLITPRMKLINLLKKRAQYLFEPGQIQINKIDRIIQEEKDKHLYQYQRPIAAYVTFENLKAAMIVKSLQKEKEEKDALNLFDKNLKINKVAAPSDIIWENLEVSTFQWFKQVVKITFCIMILLLTTTVMIYRVKHISQNRHYLFPSTKESCHV